MDCLLSLVIAAYNQYFHQVLSAYYAIKTVKEGLRVTGFAAQVIPPFVWALLICASLTSSITYAGRSPSNGAQPHSSCQVIPCRGRGLMRLLNFPKRRI
jgi:hypothetical protein